MIHLFMFVMLIYLAFTFLLTIVFIRLFLSVMIVHGHSMYPTLLPGDRLLVFRHWPSKWLHNGQIVVGDLRKVLSNIEESSLDVPWGFSNPESVALPPEKFIKRLVGLPGDKIKIHISDLHERLQTTLQSECDADGNLVWNIPRDFCFVRGDSPFSGDSILWGPISISYITGIVLAKLPQKAVGTHL